MASYPRRDRADGRNPAEWTAINLNRKLAEDDTVSMGNQATRGSRIDLRGVRDRSAVAVDDFDVVPVGVQDDAPCSRLVDGAPPGAPWS